MLPAFFGPNVITNDVASSGLTSSSFNSQKRLAKIASMLHPGDYMVFEFGHNDSKGSVSITQFQANMKTYMDSATAHGATMLFVTPTARLADIDSSTSIGGYAQATRTYAKTLGAKCIDLNAAVIKIKAALGSNNSKLYYFATNCALWPDQPTITDSTHFTDYGAYELAKWVAIQGFRSVGLPLAQYMVDSTDTFNVNSPDNPSTTTLPCSIDTIYRHAAATIRPDIKDSAFSQTGVITALQAVNPLKLSVEINMIAHCISYTANRTGSTEFSIYSINGKQLLHRKLFLSAGSGNVSWKELGRLPVGSYILRMQQYDNEKAMVQFNKL
jgi:lysophospholipase L1-like esterase